jgi:GT2 family glycosyltransferase
VVLNGAPDEDAERLRAQTKGVQVQAQAVNLGFGGALNHGRAIARGDFIVSLHDDAEVEPGWLESLLDAADQDPGAGAVGSLVLDVERRLQAAGCELVADGVTRPVWTGERPAPDRFDAVRAVDYSPSCSLLVRASSWDRIGGADERFFPSIT